jgi:hypothetical protein
MRTGRMPGGYLGLGTPATEVQHKDHRNALDRKVLLKMLHQSYVRTDLSTGRHQGFFFGNLAKRPESLRLVFPRAVLQICSRGENLRR